MTSIYLQTISGEGIFISVLIVPVIAAPLHNIILEPAKQFTYLQGLTLAHPIMNDSNFEVSLLIGADYYWSTVEDKIVRGNDLRQ